MIVIRDCRRCFQFYHYGQSEDVTMKQLKERIHAMIASMRKSGPLFLVFHDNHQDLKYLRSPEIEAPLDGLSFFLPESCTEAEKSDTPKIYVVDTSELFAALEGDSGGQKRSLGRVCRLLQIKSEFTQHLHNAGNDARVMLLPIAPSPSTLKKILTVHTLSPQGNGWWGSTGHATGYTLAPACKQQQWSACRIFSRRRG
jgi:hypothetical protein